jgi:hypothetical protein
MNILDKMYYSTYLFIVLLLSAFGSVEEWTIPNTIVLLSLLMLSGAAFLFLKRARQKYYTDLAIKKMMKAAHDNIHSDVA